MKARITELRGHLPWKWALTFDFNAQMVEAIKRSIPSRERKWNPDRREWFFKEGQLFAVEELALRYLGNVEYGPDVSGEGYSPAADPALSVARLGGHPGHGHRKRMVKRIVESQGCAILQKAA